MSEIHRAESLANLTFNLLARCQEKENHIAEAHGLLESEFKCFRLMSSKENLNNQEIAKRIKLSPGRVTRIMHGLVNKGYMELELNTKDRSIPEINDNQIFCCCLLDFYKNYLQFQNVIIQYSEGVRISEDNRSERFP